MEEIRRSVVVFALRRLEIGTKRAALPGAPGTDAVKQRVDQLPVIPDHQPSRGLDRLADAPVHLHAQILRLLVVHVQGRLHDRARGSHLLINMGPRENRLGLYGLQLVLRRDLTGHQADQILLHVHLALPAGAAVEDHEALSGRGGIRAGGVFLSRKNSRAARESACRYRSCAAGLLSAAPRQRRHIRHQHGGCTKCKNCLSHKKRLHPTDLYIAIYSL